VAELTLAEQIDTQIRTTGPMSLSTYMSLCLSHPRHGYYINGRPIGAHSTASICSFLATFKV